MELLTADEGRLALSYARSVMHEHIAGTPYDEPSWPAIFSKKRGVFVTLTIHGELRGCIGYPYPVLPLKEAIHDAACSASTEDPRFPPVKAEELSHISVEVTILTEPQLLEVAPDMRTSAIEVGRHGLIVKGFGRSGLLLPQVPVEWGWNTREFLDHTCNKAGLPAKSWLESSVQVFTFEGQIFSEKHD
ncbi:TIGR00296 family protein [Methanospirillum lacunae]|uniref:Protein DK846_03135 n=1 Tax=Methanospirillum lacunae TaxID=668570 RepID=A0A2V2N236_9EURY|nr:TIGR00296 family protein [Methanospirillum lacunae]PWR74162.1 TIGR00296 family protein [Methanospirillum lacunae]